MWRAIRHGLDGRLLDLEAPIIEEFAAEETLDRLNAWAGADVVLPERNGAQRQRALIESGAGAGGGVRRVRAGNPGHVLTGDRAMTQHRNSPRRSSASSRPRWSASASTTC